ncbi:MAG: efflux RND transporter periplasmic adaptor subunit, partial [Verrucomicrobiae bacterium]|nr:efflux RND transporter periplasmic adaptor subunit [Verrucomicrobiae bacterium]
TDGRILPETAKYLYTFQGLNKIEIEEASAGDIISLAGLEEIAIGSELRGTITWMAPEGTIVKKGEPLVKLRDVLERFELDLRKAQLDSARFQMERYQKDFEAAKSLHAQKIINDVDLRLKEVNYLQAVAQVEEATARHNLALENVQMRTICAPTNCVVAQHIKHVGEVLVITAGVENILKAVHIDSLYAIAYPDAKFVHQIRVGQKAEVRIPLGGNLPIVGTVAVVDPVVDTASGSFRVKVLLNNPDHKIKPGLHAVVTFLPEK